MKCIIRFTASVLSLVLMTLCLVGCNPQTVTEATPTPQETVSVPKKTDTVLRIPMPKQVTQLDPLQVKYQMMQEVYGLMYDTFLSIGIDRKATPNIAESWQYDTENQVWIFTVRRGVRWQGTGAELNAYDVTYTLNRIMNEDTVYSALAKKEIASYRELDLYRVEITPKSKGLTLLYALNFPVVPKESEAHGLSGAIKGTGPYVMTGVRTDEGQQVMTLKRNENWWKKKPAITDVECVFVEDEQEAMSLYSTNRLDAMSVPGVISSSFIQLGQTEKAYYLTSDYTMLVPNHRHGILGERAVRQAIAYGIDARYVVTRVYENMGVASDTPILPDSWLDRDDKMNYDYDIAKAESMLTHEGWTDANGDGIREKSGQELAFTLLIQQDENGEDEELAAALIGEMLKEIGVRVKVEAVSASRLTTRLAEGNYDMALATVTVGYSPDLSDVLNSTALKGCGYRFTNEQQLLTQLRTLQEEEVFGDKYTELQNTLLDSIPFIGLFFHENAFLYRYMTVESGLTEGQVYRNIGQWTFS